jgi:hypothetical protein
MYIFSWLSLNHSCLRERMYHIYSPGSVSTLTKKEQFFFFQKMNSFLNSEIILIFPSLTIILCDLSSEIVRSVAYDDFQHVNFIFSQIFISLFWGLFNDETELRVVRYIKLWKSSDKYYSIFIFLNMMGFYLFFQFFMYRIGEIILCPTFCVDRINGTFYNTSWK